MTRRRARISVSVLATLSLTAGVSIIATGAAQAVQAEWQCAQVSALSPSGHAGGNQCSGIGTGVGWLINSTTHVNEYRCTTFGSQSDEPIDSLYSVGGSGCIPYAQPPQ